MTPARAIIASALSAAAARRATIDAEIDEEFALHLDLLERELIDSGAEPSEARRQALARFGDVRTLHARCRRIALKEQIMLERINTVALVLVVAGMVYLAVRMETAQSQTAAAITTIAQRLQTPPAPPAPASSSRSESQASTPQPVYIFAGVARPGPYQLPNASTTFRQLLAFAGGAVMPEGRYFVIVHADGTTDALTTDELHDPAGRDVTLRPGDRIELRSTTHTFAPTTRGISHEAVTESTAPVYIGNGVPRPGAYQLPDASTTLRRMLTAAGGATLLKGSEIIIIHPDNTTETLTAEEFHNPTGPDPILQPGDRIEFR